MVVSLVVVCGAYAFFTYRKIAFLCVYIYLFIYCVVCEYGHDLSKSNFPFAAETKVGAILHSIYCTAAKFKIKPYVFCVLMCLYSK